MERLYCLLAKITSHRNQTKKGEF